jgi:hypothetical protein
LVEVPTGIDQSVAPVLPDTIRVVGVQDVEVDVLGRDVAVHDPRRDAPLLSFTSGAS